MKLIWTVQNFVLHLLCLKHVMYLYVKNAFVCQEHICIYVQSISTAHTILPISLYGFLIVVTCTVLISARHYFQLCMRMHEWQLQVHCLCVHISRTPYLLVFLTLESSWHRLCTVFRCRKLGCPHHPYMRVYQLSDYRNPTSVILYQPVHRQ